MAERGGYQWCDRNCNGDDVDNKDDADNVDDDGISMVAMIDYDNDLCNQIDFDEFWCLWLVDDDNMSMMIDESIVEDFFANECYDF